MSVLCVLCVCMSVWVSVCVHLAALDFNALPRCRAEELDADVKTIKANDKAAALRRLEDGLVKLEAAFKEVKGLAQGAREAADKCQVCAAYRCRCRCDCVGWIAPG